MKILITEPANYSKEAISIYQKIGPVDYGLTVIENQTLDYEILVIKLGFNFTHTLLATFPNLKYIVSPTTGLDHIDTNYTKTHGIKIISLQGEITFLNNIPSTAEHTIALMLALIKKIPTANNSVFNKNWNRNLFIGNNCQSKTLGLIGLGRVGKQVAKIALALGMKVQYTESSAHFKHDIPNVIQVDIVTLLKTSDIISVHIPLIGNEGYLSAELLKIINPNAYLINTSRGGIIDEVYLSDMITSYNIKGVALDVLDGEINFEESNNQHPLIALMQTHNNIIITPHIAGATVESMSNTEIFVAEKLIAAIDL